MRVRYRETHWVGVEGDRVFDVNAMCVGGWIPRAEWESQLVPWLIRECCSRGDGTWWPTHAIEVLVCHNSIDNHEMRRVLAQREHRA